MKNLIIIEKISLLLSYFYPEHLHRYIQILYKYIYSAKIKRKIGICGETFRVIPPINFKGGYYMRIGKNFRAGRNMILQCYNEYEAKRYYPHLQIGNNVVIGDDCHIGCINSIFIGDNLLTGTNVYITDHFHGTDRMSEANVPPVKRDLYSKGKVYIGNNVWLGNNVVIMPNVSIGNNVTIGAGAVVTKNLPDNCVAAGVPARVIKIKA